MANYEPDPKLKFTFGLWTVGNVGRDPFGEAVRERLSAPQICDLLGEVGAYGVNFHDNDLVPIDATPAERDQIVRDFKKALKANGLVVPMATTNLFSDPVFKDGAFTSNNAKIRALAIQKTMRAMDLGAEMGAKIYVFWGGREGVESDATKNPIDAIRRFGRRSTFSAITRSIKSTATNSPSKPSPMNRAAISISRSRVHTSPSFQRSSIPRCAALIRK